MAAENGEWIMRGPDRDDPACIRSWEALADWIDQVGFLPLFRSEIEGFSRGGTHLSLRLVERRCGPGSLGNGGRSSPAADG